MTAPIPIPGPTPAGGAAAPRCTPPDQSSFAKLARQWIPDSAADACPSCDSRFGVFLRRHHCRLCGAIFCSSCCSCFAELPAILLSQVESPPHTASALGRAWDWATGSRAPVVGMRMCQRCAVVARKATEVAPLVDALLMCAEVDVVDWQTFADVNEDWGRAARLLLGAWRKIQYLEAWTNVAPSAMQKRLLAANLRVIGGHSRWCLLAAQHGTTAECRGTPRILRSAVVLPILRAPPFCG